jgi:hypothetical protein
MVPGLDQVDIGLNYDGRWTSAVAIAAPSDPTVSILFSPSWGAESNWQFLNAGGKNCGNGAAIDEIMKKRATNGSLPPANTYSTVSQNGSQWALPDAFHRADQDFDPSPRLPRGACPSPDSDGLMAVFQPSGWVLDTYATVVAGDGTILAPFASFVDARGDGTGWWNGRRASMLPSFAGLIRKGEIAGGLIPHALAALAPANMLAQAAVWPAYAFDRDNAYSGSLPMGSLLAIPPSVDITKIGLSPAGQVIAAAAQNYGIYLVDSGGAA